MLARLPGDDEVSALMVAPSFANLPAADGPPDNAHEGETPLEYRPEPLLLQVALLEYPTSATPMALGQLALFGNLCTQLGQVVSEAEAPIQQHQATAMLDPETLKVVKSDLSGRSVFMHAGSMGAPSARLAISRCKLRSVGSMHACATVLVQSQGLRSILHAIKIDTERAGGCLITFTTLVRYDETPTKLVVVDSDVMFGLPPELLDTKAMSEESIAYLKQAARDSAPTKLLQTEFLFTSLAQLADRFVLIAFRAVAPVQSLTKTTAFVYYVASSTLEYIFGLGNIAAECQRVQRTSCTDGDGNCPSGAREGREAHERM